MSKVFSDDWMNEQGFDSINEEEAQKNRIYRSLYFLDFIDINYFLFNR
jgi:hypothetical protein